MKLRVYTFEIPFKNPFHLAGVTISKRSGLIFSLEAEDWIFWAEASPLIKFSEEKVSDLKEMTKNPGSLLKVLKDETLPVFSNDEPASLRFALSCLWYQYMAAKNGMRLNKYIDPASSENIDINAAVGLGTEKEVLESAREAIQAGYRTLKLKVGVDFDHEFNLLVKLRQEYPAIKIRIDANQAWEPKQALRYLTVLEPLGLEYCEQPIPREEFSSLGWLKNNTSVPIAADESIRTFDDARQLILNEYVDILVLKPTLIGQVDAYLSIVDAARKAGMGVITTTTFETGIGRMIVAKLTSVTKPVRYANGLGTGHFFSVDTFVDSHLIKNGKYMVHQIPAQPEVNMDVLELWSES